MPPRGRDLRQLARLARQLNGPVAEQVQNALNRRLDPAVQLRRRQARLERRQVWAGRWLTLWSLVTVLCALVSTLAFIGVIGPGALDAAVGGLMIGVVSGTLAVRSAVRRRELGRQRRALDLPGSTAAPLLPATLPPSRSLAREPMKRLAEAEATLAELLHQIAGRNGRPSPVPIESVEQARVTGAEAAAALRAVAAQLVVVERARDHAPAADRGALDDGVYRLRDQLLEGLDGYGSLVAAAGRVVVASSVTGPRQDLSDATDHLHGLAVALRELSPNLD